MMKTSVLVVDRDRELARLYFEYLSDNGFSTDVAATREECLAMVRERPWDVLILDRENPRCDAKSVITRLRNEVPSLPVILTTWVASPDRVPRLVVPPVVLCLRKFFPLPQLLDSIRLTAKLGGAQQRAPAPRRPRGRAADAEPISRHHL
jgi:DNA-binding response OmpR family regulator